MIEGLYPKALDAGIDPFMFWDYSVAEIIDILESHNRQLLNKNKETARMYDFLAMRTAEYVGSSFSEETKVVPLWDYFPALFAKENKAIEQLEIDRQLAINIENMRAFANYANKRFKGNGGE